MKYGDIVKVTVFRGWKCPEPIWMKALGGIEENTTGYRDWWAAEPLCGPAPPQELYNGDLYKRRNKDYESIGMSHSGKRDEWEVIGPNPPDEFYVAMAKQALSE